jgi:hypothetical protein
MFWPLYKKTSLEQNSRCISTKRMMFETLFSLSIRGQEGRNPRIGLKYSSGCTFAMQKEKALKPKSSIFSKERKQASKV